MVEDLHVLSAEVQGGIMQSNEHSDVHGDSAGIMGLLSSFPTRGRARFEAMGQPKAQTKRKG